MPVVPCPPACPSVGWRRRARCGRMNAERTEPSQGFVNSSRHLTNCMLVVDPPWHRFPSFSYDGILASPGAAWKMQRDDFSTPPIDREHMATKTGASHFRIGLLGSRFGAKPISFNFVFFVFCARVADRRRQYCFCSEQLAPREGNSPRKLITSGF